MSRATVFAISRLRKLIAADGVNAGAPSSYNPIFGRRPSLELAMQRAWAERRRSAEKAARAERGTGKAYSESAKSVMSGTPKRAVRGLQVMKAASLATRSNS